jgi:collagen triple helix repeat protein
MRRLVASRATSAVAVGLLVLAIAGGGFAIASDGGTIRACAHKGTQVLYTGKCKKGDKKLSWSQVGPRGAAGQSGASGAVGPRGVTGATGAPGAPGTDGNVGPIGPSEAFNATAASGPADIGLSPTFTTVLSFTLPPGSYVLNSEVVAANQSTTTAADVRCTLFSQTDPQMTATTVVHVPAGSSAAIPLQGVQNIAGSSSFQSLQCRKSANVTVQIGEDPEFTAILVGSIAAP